MYAIAGKKWGIPIAGIDRSMKELEWHISKFCTPSVSLYKMF
jgi:hypothetical protein